MERTESHDATEAPQSSAQLLTLKEAAALLEMHWKTLEILACHGEIPAIKIGKKWRFRGSGPNQWLSARLQPVVDWFIDEERLLEIKEHRPGEYCDQGLSYATVVSYLSVLKHFRAKWCTVRLAQVKPLGGARVLDRHTRARTRALYRLR